jgi:hypothetical protein
MISRFFCLFFLLMCLAATPALAQNKEVTESDKAVFAFFHLTGGTPDYEQWVRNSDKYLAAAADPKLQADLYEIETLRLKWGFGTYNKDKDFLKIRTPVKLAINNDPKHGKLSFLFPTADGHVPYFPFNYGKEWIALIVGDVENFLTVPLSPDEYAFIRKQFQPDTPYDGEILLRIKAVKADASNTLPLDGLDQWLMMGETGYMELIYTPPAETEIVLWSFMAPWYMSDAQKDLLPLLGK